MNKINLMQDVTAEIKRVKICRELKQLRVNELVSDMTMHKLLGNQETFKRCGRFIMNHSEELMRLDIRRGRLINIFEKIAG